MDSNDEQKLSGIVLIVHNVVIVLNVIIVVRP